MNICVLGAGNAGCATAADLAKKGFNVTLIKTSNSINNDNFDYLIKSKTIILKENGIDTQCQIDCVTHDISQISNADIIFVYIQTIYHEELIERIIPQLRDGQIIVFNPGYLSTAYMLKHSAFKKDITVVEAESSFIDCRIIAPGVIDVSFRNVRNPIGIYPRIKAASALHILKKTGFSFSLLESVIETAFHNPNLIVHTVGAIMSIPRIEYTKGNYCMYHEVFTPSVWRIVEALDSEKMFLLNYFGYKKLKYVEACKFRNTLDDSIDAKQAFFDYANMPNVVKGPSTVFSRYILEDVSQGLVLLESISKNVCKTETPVSTSLINIASFALDIDFRKSGRDINALGMNNIIKILNDSGSPCGGGNLVVEA